MKYTKSSVITLASVLAGGIAQASTDYGPAIYRPMSGCSKWNSSGNGHSFAVCHDMEGYYASGISYLNRCDISVSINYMVNGKQDTSTDYPAGQIDQQVRESVYAWHARCWNSYMFGTEHEGFRNSPAWYTTEMYNATGPLQRHLMDVTGKAKDRNHVIGHDEKRNAAWVNWANANYAFDPTCNSHDDPGPYWDWARLMSIINPPTTSVIVDNSNAGFAASTSWATSTGSTDKYGADYRYHSTSALSDQAVWTGSPSGTHTAYAYYPQGSNRSTTAPYTVVHGGVSSAASVNQQINGGTWVSLGTYAFNAGEAIKLSFWTGTGFVVVADAVKWQ
ncbi:MAG: N-acetylmuramyl-L-alanine amidase, negative regulator of AmpC, AmpD [Verrucomicrobiales bacterium]|nr:N-acetylmuramyl-L-alanine amidase, negative regulator of AmpC, AmpD [Verrucomicrobiales bacterium]